MMEATPTISGLNDPSSDCNGTDGSISVSGVGSGTLTWNGTVSGNEICHLRNLGAGLYDDFNIELGLLFFHIKSNGVDLEQPRSTIT